MRLVYVALLQSSALFVGRYLSSQRFCWIYRSFCMRSVDTALVVTDFSSLYVFCVLLNPLRILPGITTRSLALPPLLACHTLWLSATLINCTYTGCPRRKGPNFGRVFLRSNYTDITQNTYIQSSMVTEILNIEK